MNRKSKKYEKIQSKTVLVLYDFLRVVVSVWVCECACMRVCVIAAY